MNGINKRVNPFSAANLCAKLAGTLGFASASALLAFPAFSASPSLSKVNPNPTIFSEAPYSRVAQSTGSGAPRTDTVPNLDRGGTPGGMATPSGTPTNPSSAPVAEPSNIGPTQNRSTSGGSTNSTTMPSAAPGGTPTNPSAAPNDGGPGSVVVPSSSDSSGGMNMPTPAQGGSISPNGSNPTDSTTTPSSIPANPDRSTTPSTTDGTTPSYTPNSPMTAPSSTDSTTTPSSTPSSGSGGVRALW